MRGGMIDNARGQSEKGRNEEGQQKSVTMAPISSYLNKQKYVMRTPMFSVREHPSILKKTFPKEHVEKEEHLMRNYLFSTSSSAERSLESLGPPPGGPPPSAAVPSSHMGGGIPEVGRRWLEEGAPAGAASPQRWPCSVLEAQTLSPPRRPQLTSTVLNPTYTPLSRTSGQGRSESRLRGRDGGGRTRHKLDLSGESEWRRSSSSHQADYWACAIPKTLPPSGGRWREPDWDPDQDYEALLNYTYPVRAGHGECEWGGWGLQDSGIEADRPGRSSSLSGLDSCLSSARPSACGSALSASDLLLSSSSPSQTLPTGWTLDATMGGGGTEDGGAGDRRHHVRVPSPAASTALVRSAAAAAILPSRCVAWDLDHEFLALPDHLEELQLVARKVRKLTAQLSRPVTAGWSGDPATEDGFKEQEDSREGHDHEGHHHEGHHHEGHHHEGHNHEGHHHEGHHHEGHHHEGHHHEAAVGRSEPAGSPESWKGPSRPGHGEPPVLGEELRRLTLHHIPRSGEEEQEEEEEEEESLIRNIQVFCWHLERLIQWLYTLPEKMELLVLPSVDVDSVKVSLAGYQTFQRDVSSHRPLTSRVLHSGQRLLRCMSSTSPVIGDTLMLIERQSRALEIHGENFFSSILAAMDSITQPGPTSPSQQRRGEEASRVGC